MGEGAHTALFTTRAFGQQPPTVSRVVIGLVLRHGSVRQSHTSEDSHVRKS